MSNENNNQFNNEARENHDGQFGHGQKRHTTDRRIININHSTETLMEENQCRTARLRQIKRRTEYRYHLRLR